MVHSIAFLVVAATDKQTQTYLSLLSRESYSGAKYIFIIQVVCGSLLRLGVSNITIFKSGDTEKCTKL
jgi:hypothetical protein